MSKYRIQKSKIQVTKDNQKAGNKRQQKQGSDTFKNRRRMKIEKLKNVQNNECSAL